ncbi:MAG: MMPL family transporter [Solirubrobacteraceae bacterium]
MRRFARLCVRRRRVVVLVWVAMLAICTLLGQSAGSHYTNSLALSGTGSTQATNLLSSVAPRVSGDVEQVVFQSDRAPVTAAGVRTRVERMLDRVAAVPHVTQVSSPYQPAGAAQISADKRVAFALATFDRAAWNVSATDAKRLVAAARSGDGRGLRVAVAGQVAENSETPALNIVLIGVLAAAVVLAVAFGSLLAMLLPLASALVSLGAALGLIELLSNAIAVPQVTTQLVPLLGLGVGVDYALFIVSRHRQGLVRGLSVEESIAEALDTSGRAVIFAGSIVCIAVAGMLALGIDFFNGLAVATIIGVGLTMATALTLLPAMLGFLGPRVLSRRQRARRTTQGSLASAQTGFWVRWAGQIHARPAVLAAVALILVAVLASPFLSLRLGTSDQGNDPPGTTTREAYDMLSAGFGPGYNGPLILVAKPENAGQKAAFASVINAVGATPGLAKVTRPQQITGADAETVAMVDAYQKSSPGSSATAYVVQRLRQYVIPASSGRSGLRVYVGGSTAVGLDFAHVISAKLPLFIGLIVGLSVIVLAVVFRSLLIPVLSAAMNLLSIGVAFGVLAAVFQWGWAGSLIGASRSGPIDAWMPALTLSILFGLSMDYQVFLLTRIHEEWLRTGDERQAARDGLAASGRTIAAAAAVMVFVFAAFALGDLRVLKEFGIALAAGVLLDALLIRSMLVPASLILLGRATWWFPPLLERRLPHIAIEPTIPIAAGEES